MTAHRFGPVIRKLFRNQRRGMGVARGGSIKGSNSEQHTAFLKETTAGCNDFRHPHAFVRGQCMQQTINRTLPLIIFFAAADKEP
jgi:hypothetical protein